MTDRRHRRATTAALGLLLCSTAACAGAVIDLASEDAPSLGGETQEEQFGYCVALGDLDGDGRGELIVGAPGAADSSGVLHAGAVYVFRAATLEELEEDTRASDAAVWTLRGGSYHGRFGSALAAGDLDGDGFDDLAVGAPAGGHGGDIARGEVSVFFGGPAGSVDGGFSTVPDVVLTGASPGARLGTFLLAHDIDGNGTAELLLSEPMGGGTPEGRAGIVYVVEGAALRASGGAATAATLASASITGENTFDSLSGLTVADTNGDGTLELILGAYLADGPGLEDAGKVYTVEIPDTSEGLSSPPPLDGTPVLTGVVERGFLGRSVSAGDVDFDGIDDLLIAAFGSKAGGEKLEATGEVYVLFGDSGDAVMPSLDDPELPRFRGDSRSDMFGLPVLLADVNGDGAADVVVAAQFADGPGNDRRACGEVHVYWGSLPSVMVAKAGNSGLADVTIVGESPEDSIGGTLFFVGTSDGTNPALLIGAPDAPCTGDDGEAIHRCGKLIVLSRESLLR